VIQLTMSLMGPSPCTSQQMLIGPPRLSATGAMPERSGWSCQMAVGKAGCCSTSATGGIGFVTTLQSALARHSGCSEAGHLHFAVYEVNGL